jgi:hypothetical protein
VDTRPYQKEVNGIKKFDAHKNSKKDSRRAHTVYGIISKSVTE